MKIKNFPLLDFFRVFAVGLMALIVGSNAFLNFSFYPDAFWQPQGILQFFKLNQISVEVARVALLLFWISTICALLGFFTRTSLILVGLTTTLLFSLKMSFGFMSHRESPLIVTVFILSAYPVSQRLSLDSRLFKKKKAATKNEAYGLLVCLRLFLCLVYFSAAISKLLAHGLEWITTPTLQYYLLFCDVTIPINWAQTLWPYAGYHLAMHPTVCYIFSALVILVEFSAPLAFVRKLRYPIVGGLVILQISILLFLKISFVHLAPLFLAWLPWEKWLHLTKAAK